MLRSPVPHLIQELTQPDQTDSPQEERVGCCPLLHLSSWKASMFEEDRRHCSIHGTKIYDPGRPHLGSDWAFICRDIDA